MLSCAAFLFRGLRQACNACRGYKYYFVLDVFSKYLYTDPSGFCFMNTETYDQIFVEDHIIGESKKFLLPNTKIQIEFYEEKPIGLSFPETVDLKIVETDPPLKGATASGSGKPATLETGLVVTVPQFVEVGEVVRVSTTSGDYLERVKG